MKTMQNTLNLTINSDINSIESVPPTTPISPSFSYSYYPFVSDMPYVSNTMTPYYVTSCCNTTNEPMCYTTANYHYENLPPTSNDNIEPSSYNTMELSAPFPYYNHNLMDLNWVVSSPALSSPTENIERILMNNENLSKSIESFKPAAGRPSTVNNKAKRRVMSLNGLDKVKQNIIDNNVKQIFECPKPECQKVFKRSEHLKRHLNTVHSAVKPYQCPFDQCTKRFSRSDNLNQHYKTHLPKLRKNSASF